ncbi:hypothetical protein H6504_01520 [Candidatus Woesearchaeota archaeon]|nr:hypothetical protein [Candidatus Woesearchaeota archaeon]
MATEKELYQTLELMMDAFRNKDKEDVLRLNKIFDAQTMTAYHVPRLPLDFLYDGCRTSMVMYWSWPELSEQFEKDAYDKFDQIVQSR